MSLTSLRCEICGEVAHCYDVTLPKKNPRQCKHCHTYLEPRTETHHFCSLKCLKIFVDSQLGASEK